MSTVDLIERMNTLLARAEALFIADYQVLGGQPVDVRLGGTDALLRVAVAKRSGEWRLVIYDSTGSDIDVVHASLRTRILVAKHLAEIEDALATATDRLIADLRDAVSQAEGMLADERDGDRGRR